MMTTLCPACGGLMSSGHRCSETVTPWPTRNEDQRRIDPEEAERRREQVRRFVETQQARRAMWRKRRGWATP